MARPYGKEHQIFLQGLMSKGIMSYSEVLELYELAHKRNNGKPMIIIIVYGSILPPTSLYQRKKSES
jgi:hypothetical protein